MNANLPLWLAVFAGSVTTVEAGLHQASVSPGNVPWPGGVVPYVIDGSLSIDQRQTYLDGLREWELAANVHFIPRTAETQYVFFKYSPTGPNLVSGSQPQTVEINLLTRGQICHEMGHSFGLEHEHQRPNRDTYITVLYGNVTSGNNSAFDILPGSVSFGSYDFESVMHYGRNVYTTAPWLDTIQPKPGYEKYQPRLSNAALSPEDRAHLASLYGAPLVPLSSVVTTTADGGVGSLRAAIYYAQDHPGSTVTFNIPTSDPGYVGGVFTIKPTGHLPPLATNGLTIDATTQPGYVGKPVVFVNGSELLTEVGQIPAFLFLESNCTVKGLGVQQFPWSGMVMRYPDATGNRIAGCSVGVDSIGNAAAPNAFQGIMISDGAHGNFVGGTGTNERNVISGNTQYGIWISGSTTTGNSVLGNYIGTNIAGTAANPNNAGGVILIDGANHNIIGGDTAAARNVISGNTDAGIWITGSGVDSNTVKGNYVGTNAVGTAALSNTFNGINILGGAANNIVSGNILSGNVSEGLRIADSGTTGNKVYGNLAGISPTGGTIPNGFAGVSILFGATGNQVGGAMAGQRNTLSGNGKVGLAFGSTGTSGNLAYGNYIGTDISGMSAIPNGIAGVYITGGCSGNYLGNGPGTGNLISGNAVAGVYVGGQGTTGNFIRNNRVGPNAAGGVTTPQQYEGIWLLDESQSNVVGGTVSGAANVITGNSGRGISLFDSTSYGQTFQRNSIFGNGGQPVGLFDGSNHGQAKPVLNTAVLATGTTVTGSLTSTANTAFTIEFFSSPDSRNFIGSTTVTTNGSGAASFNVTLPAIVSAGHSVSATATSQATGDTSEYSSPVTVTSFDSDNDGLPNAYESATPGLSSANPLDAALDNDGDGFTNLQEFIAGTNPNSSSSRLVSTGVVSASDYVVSFGTVTGKFYRLERSETLLGAWETISIHIAGTGGVVAVPVPLSPSANRQFFRIAAGE
ncbi:MAG: M12 family metallopeptidase [Luteolibacter sp.]|uniref:M12 family metallopeptidase n=1 Tax=Luteolibacter sp. TaxID=1962973 RepID=UPI003267A4BF